MNPLEVTTLELWSVNAKRIIKEKGLSTKNLKDIFGDKIIFPWQNNYDQQRMLFSTQIQERPLFIIKAKNECDVIVTLNLINKYSLTIRIVNGRHSVALFNPDVFLDVAAFTKIELKKYLVIECGVTQGMANDYLFTNFPGHHFVGGKPNHPNSLIFGGGSAASVSTSGISTIGGVGTLVRTVGLTIDHIKSFKIVLPPQSKNLSACIVTASRSKNSDLFWALRGGGAPNFGVVLEITYYPLKINKVVLYEITWPWNQAKHVINKWQKTAINLPNTFNENLAIFNGVDNDFSKFAISLTGIYTIPDGQTSGEAVALVTDAVKYLGGKLTINKASMYADVYKKFVAGRVYHNFSIGKIILTKDFLNAKDLVSRIDSSKYINGKCYIGIQLLGGKVSEKSYCETAFYPREANFFVDIFNFWDSPVYQESNLEWNKKTFETLYVTNGPYIYLGFPITNLPDYLNAYYGKNKKRLLEINKKVDPMRLLKFPGSL